MSYTTWEKRLKAEREQELVDAHNRGFASGKRRNQNAVRAVGLETKKAHERARAAEAKCAEYRALLMYVDMLMEGSQTEFALKLRATLHPQGKTLWRSIKNYIFWVAAQFFT